MPPSGHVAGVWARSDDTRGVHKAPANEVIRGALGLELSITKGEHDQLNPKGINCIRAFPGRGIRVWGARTLSSDPSWRYLNVRRLFNYIEESILEGTQWVVFEPNDLDLWQRVKRTINAFLLGVWRDGALFGATPAGGLLRQVRLRDEPARRGRRRPARRRDRHRARQARRVRDLPHRAVLRRRVAQRVGGPGTDRSGPAAQPSQRVSRSSCHRTSEPRRRARVVPLRHRDRRHRDRPVLRDCRARVRDRRHRAQGEHQRREARHPQVAGRHEASDDHPQARQELVQGALGLARGHAPGQGQRGAQERLGGPHELRRPEVARYNFTNALGLQGHDRGAQGRLPTRS